MRHISHGRMPRAPTYTTTFCQRVWLSNTVSCSDINETRPMARSRSKVQKMNSRSNKINSHAVPASSHKAHRVNVSTSVTGCTQVARVARGTLLLHVGMGVVPRKAPQQAQHGLLRLRCQ